MKRQSINRCQTISPLFLLLFLLVLKSKLPVAISTTSPQDALGNSPHRYLVQRNGPEFSEQPLRDCKNKIYCLPSANITWYYEEVGWIQWNNQNDRFVSGSRQVNIYLYERVKSEPSAYGEHNLLAEFNNIENTSGLFNLTVSDTILSKWNPSYFNVPGNSNTTRTHFVVVTWPENTLDADKGDDFFISSFARPGTSASVAVNPTAEGPHPTVTHMIAGDPVYRNDESTRTSVVIIGCIASGLFLAFLALVFVFMRRKHKMRTEMRESLPTGSSARPITTEKGPTMSHTTDSSLNDTAEKLLPSDAAVAPATLISPDDNAPLSSSDARLIALTYRQMLRKPTWQTMPEEEEKLTPEEEEERKKAEKEARRHSEAIMRRELQVEGRGLKTVSVHSMYNEDAATSGFVRTSSSSSPTQRHEMP